MWQVKHLKGFTFVSNRWTVVSQRICAAGPKLERSEGGCRLTSQDVPLQMLISGEGLSAVGTKDHFGSLR